MEITIKNLSVTVKHSEETFCFTATAYVDGVKAFSVSNRGRGEMNSYRPLGLRGAGLLSAAKASALAARTAVESPQSYTPDMCLDLLVYWKGWFDDGGEDAGPAAERTAFVRLFPAVAGWRESGPDDVALTTHDTHRR